MKEIPILFSTPMVQALLAGRKTQTRRVSGLKEINVEPSAWRLDRICTHQGKYERDRLLFIFAGQGLEWHLHCPYGKPGDLLWVREGFRKYCHVDEAGYTKWDDVRLDYRADRHEELQMIDADGWKMFNKDGSEKFVPWKPSIHIPKEAARIWLEVESVKVERLQEISEEDALSEGISGGVAGVDRDIDGGWWPGGPQRVFKQLWQSINGPESWDANPWVWVVSFKVLSTTGKPS